MSLLDGLVGHWKADNDFLDSSGNGNNITGVGNTFSASIKKLGTHSAHFETNDYAQRGAQIFSAYPFTLSCWFKKDDTDDTGALVWLGDASADNVYYMISATSSPFAGTITARNTSTKSNDSVTTIEDTDWHFLVGNFASNTSRKLYLDGKYEAEGTDSVIYSAMVDRISFAAMRRLTPAQFYDGHIDDIAVWSRPLTDGGISIGETAGGEIATLWNGGAGVEDFANPSPSARHPYAKVVVPENKGGKIILP